MMSKKEAAKKEVKSEKKEEKKEEETESVNKMSLSEAAASIAKSAGHSGCPHELG